MIGGFLACFLVLCSGGLARDAVAEGRPVRSMTGCYDLWPPYTLAGGGGITPELVRAVANHADVSVTLIQMPWKRCLTAVEQGSLSFALDATPRPGYLTSALPVTHVRTGVFALLGRFADLSDVAGMPEVLIGRPLGWSNWETISDEMPSGPTYTVVQAGEADQMLEMLRHNRIDLYVDDVQSARSLAARHGIRLTTLLIPPDGTDLYVLFGRDRFAEKEMWDAAVTGLQATGWLDAHFRRHHMAQ
ncbi:hypothetical protein GCM10027256_18410 [Novispirillum itersonii subsp. nipponicum]